MSSCRSPDIIGRTALAVQDLRLSHFRSYREARIVTDRHAIVLHGANGVGKTNILEAVSLFSPGRGLRAAAAERIARRPESIGWKVGASFALRDRIIEADTTYRPEDGRTVRIGGKAARQADLGQNIRILWLTPQMDRLWMGGSDGRRKYLDRMAMSLFPAHAQAVIGYEKAMRERNRLLRDSVRDPLWYEGLERQMATYGVRVARAREDAVTLVAEAFGQAVTAFPVATLSVTARDGEPGLMESEDQFCAALGRDRNRHVAAGRTLIGPHLTDLEAVYQERDMAADQCSTGEQKALLISLILANARALARLTGMAPILLLDEVAAHLDADRRRALFAEVAALGSQCWMTGTDAGLFDGLTGAKFLAVSLPGDASSVEVTT